MRETKSELDRAAMLTGKRLVGGIAVDLQNAGKARQLSGDLLGAAAVGEHIEGPPHGRSSTACAQNWQMRVRRRPGSSTGIGVSSQNSRSEAWIVRSWSS